VAEIVEAASRYFQTYFDSRKWQSAKLENSLLSCEKKRRVRRISRKKDVIWVQSSQLRIEGFDRGVVKA
jgi:hypothetical protein